MTVRWRLSFLSRPDMTAKLEECGFMVFEDPSRGINALAALTHFGQAFAKSGGGDAPPVVPGGAPPVAKGAALNETQSKAMLAAYGLPMVDERTVASAAAAAEAANGIGYPVVMKIVSADILHKSEIGGVILNVQDADAASEAFEHIDGSRQAACAQRPCGRHHGRPHD